MMRSETQNAIGTRERRSIFIGGCVVGGCLGPLLLALLFLFIVKYSFNH
jgi:hypothetical protein